ncbi:MAG: hypothetical protein U0326_09410 [Polyangiales bacterium]
MTTIESTIFPPDDAPGAMAEASGDVREPREVVRHERDIGRFERDIGAGRAHRRCRCSLPCERRRVVHTIPHHRDLAIALAQFRDAPGLVLGAQVREDLVDARFRADRVGGAALSPVSMTTRVMPARFSAAMASPRRGEAGPRSR